MSLKEELLQIKTYEEYEPQREKCCMEKDTLVETLNMVL